MAEKLYLRILELLSEKQLSISALSRQLKNEGLDEHRLILTGYLRALRDLNILDELDIPPSKIYNLPEKSQISLFGNQQDQLNIYSLLRDQLMKIELDHRIPIGVYVISRLFERPCFRIELKMIGITPKHLEKYLEKPGIISEASDPLLKKYRSDITKIEVPSDDPAYEVKENSKDRENSREVVLFANEFNEVLAGVLKQMINLEGLVPRSKQTTLLP